MAKIFEVDFTKFNPPSSFNAVENINGDDLTDNTGNILKQTTLPGFSFRPGIFFQKDNVFRKYNLRSTSPNADWHGTFSKRSWVIWFYVNGTLPENYSRLWGEGDIGVGSTCENGLQGSSTLADLNLHLNNSVVYTFTNIYNTPGWYNIVITTDKGLSETKAYLNGTLQATIGNTTSSTLFGSYENNIGDRWTSRESTVFYGYAATYDTVLNLTEVQNIYNTFLNDSYVGETAVATLTGAVLDENFNSVSGVDVYLLDNDGDNLVARTVTSSGGNYSVIVPTLGDYTVVASRPPYKGTAAESFTVPSSGVIVFHND